MPVFSLADALQKREWRYLFDQRALSRASGYGNRVADLQRRDEDDAVVLSARVQGTASRPYRTTVAIRAGRRGTFGYDCDCTCPVGVECKHAAALLMAAEQRTWPEDGLSAAAAAPWKSWADALLLPNRPPLPPAAAETAPDAAQRRLAVIFDTVERAVPAPLLATMVWVRKTRQGRWGKPEPVRLDGPGNDLDSGLIDGLWCDRLARLRLRPPVSHPKFKTMHLLRGPNAQALLEELLHAEVLRFWQTPSARTLAPGPARTMQWHWRIDDAGSQRLRTDEGVLAHVDGQWLYDPATSLLQPLHSDLPPTLIAALKQMPPLLPEHAHEFLEHAREHPVLSALPSPRTIAVAAPVDVRPTPVLRLLLTPLQPTGWARDPNKHLPCVRLQYDYAGQRLPGPPSIEDLRQLDGDTLRTVRRHRESELAAEQALTDAGFRQIQTQYGLHHRIAQTESMYDYVAGKPGNPEYDAAVFLRKALALAASGFRIDTDPSFPLIAAGTPDDWYASVGNSPSGEAWFETELGFELDGERISLLPILRRALEDRSLNLLAPAPGEPADAVWYALLPDMRMVALPLAKLRGLVAPLLQWLLEDGQSLRLPRAAAGLLDDLSQHAQLELRGKTAAALRTLATELRNAGARRPVAVPRTLKATLRPYQRDGLTWLDFLARTGLGGVLADDMGLGKTVQILAHLLKEREAGRLDAPALVVCPTSVVGNWHEQAARFAPVLRVRIVHGSARHDEYRSLDACDLAITTYALLPRDRDALMQQRFSLAIFDEAQALKNAASQAAQVARALPARRKLAVTGTPLENHLGELWSQFECVLPGLLGDGTSFARHFRTPIEKHGDRERQQQLNRRIAGFLLRRTKAQVAQDLPPKTEIVRTLELSGKQRALYETLRLTMHDKVKQAVESRGLGRSSIVILDALLKLRQACCDPRLIKIEAARKTKESAKLDALLAMLDELLSEGRRILLFSQFTGMLDLIEQALAERDIAWLRLDGASRNRAQLVQRFQSGEAPLFLISLKAGGVGLNLTAADTVIHYDPWWNPATEAQATDRAHRIGQTQPVFVYKLICAGTVEEKIMALQQRKGELARAVLEEGSTTKLSFNQADIEELFAPLE